MRYILLLSLLMTLAACSLGDNDGGEPTAEPMEAPTTACQDIEAIGLGEGAPVTITPSQLSGDGCYALPGGGTYTVRWDAPPGTTEVSFYRRSLQMFRSDTIGVDRDPSDGFSVTFQLDGAMPPSQLWADGITDPTVSGSMIQGQVVGIYMAN